LAFIQIKHWLQNFTRLTYNMNLFINLIIMSGERDILIEGRGISGYNLAAKLSDGGWNVLLSGREFKVPRSWFVLSDRLPEDTRELVKDGTIPSHPHRACRFIIVDSHTGDVKDDFTPQTRGKLDDFACLMIDDTATKGVFRDRAFSSGISVVPSSVKEVKANGQGYNVLFENGDKHKVNKVVDASGTASNVLRRLESGNLRDDALVYWIYGWRVKGNFDSDTMIFPLKDKSSGRMSWIAPWSDEVADVLAADYCRVSEFYPSIKSGHFQEVYERFRELCTSLNICRIDQEMEKVYGRTRIVPISKAYGGDGIFAVGDAAGQACPNMAEGVPPAILNSNYLATQLNQDPNYRGRDYYGDWRHGRQKIEPYELSTAFLLARLPEHEAGKNAGFYRAIANTRDVNRMMRVTAERRIRLSDLPELLRLGFAEPELLSRTASLLIRSRLAFTLPGFRKTLYGENGA
jgi:flavin-dependent dehydrogenase